MYIVFAQYFRVHFMYVFPKYTHTHIPAAVTDQPTPLSIVLILKFSYNGSYTHVCTLSKTIQSEPLPSCIMLVNLITVFGILRIGYQLPSINHAPEFNDITSRLHINSWVW